MRLLMAGKQTQISAFSLIFKASLVVSLSCNETICSLAITSFLGHSAAHYSYMLWLKL